jgi:RNase adaptor protein for sRNA GlmZ degradation
MKDKILPNNYHLLSLEELTDEASKMIEFLEKENDLENSILNYQKLLQLNTVIEKKFYKNSKQINQKTREKIEEIRFKKDAK